MTPERKEENKLKKGDRVVMHTCIEAEVHGGRIWTCSGDQFTRGTGALAQDSIFLEGFSGSFAPEFLQKVILPSEDEHVLAALEEAQQQNMRWKEAITGLMMADTDVQKELAEAQQTIAEQHDHIKTQDEIITGYSQTIARQREALNGVFDQGYEALNVSYPTSKHEIAIRSMTKSAMLAIQAEEGETQP